MNIRTGFLSVIIGSGVLLGACKKSEPAQPATTNEEMPAPATDEEVPAKSLTGSVAAIMKPYEDCLALLAADTAEGIANCAQRMSDAAKNAADDAPDRAKEALASIASAADALAAAGNEDLEKVRSLYGDVSKEAVALLTAVPEAAKDYHVFECPMAKGYKRWAQADDKMTNPYMGTKMLECGSEVHDHHKDMGDAHTMDTGDGE